MGRPLGSSSLRSAIEHRLAADATLVAALGGAKFCAEAADGMIAPYLMLQVEASHPAGGIDLDVEAHTLVIEAVSRQRTGAELYWISARVSWLLDPASLILRGHSLMYFGPLETRDIGDGDLRRARLAFRALTMPEATVTRKPGRTLPKTPPPALPAVTEPIALG